MSGLVEQMERAKPGSRLHKQIQEMASATDTVEQEAQKLPEEVRALFKERVRKMLNSPLLIEVVREITRQASVMVDIPRSVSDAQVQVLGEIQNVQKRAELLQPFSWELEDSKPNTFVLGDNGPLGRGPEKSEWKHPISMDGLSLICVPISHQCLLVGRLPGATDVIDHEEVNTNSVELSREFFVARTDSLRERAYQKSIGKRAMIFDPAELRSLIEEGLESTDTPKL